MPLSFNLISLGCPKNQVDSEVMFTRLKTEGIKFVSDIKNCDVCVINTCGFIEAARKESVEVIIDIIQKKKEGSLRYIAVTGCLVNNNLEALKKELPEVDIFLPSFEEDKIVEELNKKIIGRLDNSDKKLDKPYKSDKSDRSNKFVKSNKAVKVFKSFEREHFNLKATAYLKISEGCGRVCSFCTIPKIRGKYKSRPIEEIKNEAAYLARNGVRELILISQDTSCYGVDLNLKNGLYLLLKELIKIKDISWIRLLYLYPSKSLFTNDLISLIKNEEKILKYIDIPIQHISDNVLRLMKRGETQKDIMNLIQMLKAEIKGIALRTSLIAGFPGETEEDFLELLSFIKDVEFDNLGVFKYSDEKEAPSFLLKDKVALKVKNERYKSLMTTQADIMEGILSKHVGKVYDAVIDEVSGKTVKARTYFQSLDIDGCAYLSLDDFISNGYGFKELSPFIPVKITKIRGYDLIGTVDR